MGLDSPVELVREGGDLILPNTGRSVLDERNSKRGNGFRIEYREPIYLIEQVEEGFRKQGIEGEANAYLAGAARELRREEDGFWTGRERLFGIIIQGYKVPDDLAKQERAEIASSD